MTEQRSEGGLIFHRVALADAQIRNKCWLLWRSGHCVGILCTVGQTQAQTTPNGSVHIKLGPRHDEDWSSKNRPVQGHMESWSVTLFCRFFPKPPMTGSLPPSLHCPHPQPSLLLLLLFLSLNLWLTRVHIPALTFLPWMRASSRAKLYRLVHLGS